MQQKQYDKKRLESILEHFDNIRKRVIMKGIKGKTSNWLNPLPLSYYHFDLPHVVFCDAIVTIDKF